MQFLAIIGVIALCLLVIRILIAAVGYWAARRLSQSPSQVRLLGPARPCLQDIAERLVKSNPEAVLVELLDKDMRISYQRNGCVYYQNCTNLDNQVLLGDSDPLKLIVCEPSFDDKLAVWFHAHDLKFN